MKEIIIKKKSQYDTYYDKLYKRGSGKLRPGDRVMVHPTRKSQSTEAFEARVIEEEMIFNSGRQMVLCTHVDGGYSAVINDYLFDRLERI